MHNLVYLALLTPSLLFLGCIEDIPENEIGAVFANPNGDPSWMSSSVVVNQPVSRASTCIDGAWIHRVANGGREMVKRGPFDGTDGNCHTQGVGYRSSDRRLVTTCQDDGDVARVESWQSGSGASKGKMNIAKHSTPVPSQSYLQHPSSTQIAGNYFPVAFANHSDKNGTYGSKLAMAELSSSGELSLASAEIAVVNTGTSQDNPHLGTTGLFKTGSDYLVYSCDYNCRNIYKHQWNADNNSWTYLGAISGTSADVGGSNGVAWDAYNSLNVVPSCTNSDVYMVGTKHEGSTNKIHIWKIIEGGGVNQSASQLQVENIAWRHFVASKRYFREGVALINDAPRAHFLTFGENFNFFNGNLSGHELFFYIGNEERSAGIDGEF